MGDKPREWAMYVRYNGPDELDDFLVIPPAKKTSDGGMIDSYARGLWDECIIVREVKDGRR